MAIKCGADYKYGEVKRDKRIPWKDQVDALAEQYEGFDWTSINAGVIRFVYLSERSENNAEQGLSA